MKKGIAFLLAGILLAASICGCAKSNSNSSTGSTVTSVESTTKKASEDGKRTVIDALGREVEIPEKVEKVVPLANALRMMAYADCIDLVAGVEVGEREQTLVKAYNWINYDKWKDLPEVGEGGSGGYTPYTEEIVQLAPDVIICAYAQEDAENLQKKTGVPVVVINSGTMFEEDYNESLRIIGEVCEKEDRCKEVVNYINEVKEDLNKRTANIADADKKLVYSGAVSFAGGHGIEGTYTNFPPFKAINAVDIFGDSQEKPSGVTIEKEKILKADPDIIFLDPNNLKLVNDDYAVNTDFYKSLKAVKNGDIYTMLGYNWYYTNLEIAMADCYYAGSVVFPDAFKDIDPVKKANEIFEKMLGNSAKDYYKDLEGAGFGFGKITLGE